MKFEPNLTYFWFKFYLMPRVSVLMPNYNASEFIEESIMSVLNQTYQDFEIILIDDCSTDNSLELVKRINNSKIKLYSTLENGGIVSALNEGLKHVKSEFIIRMDSDDISVENRFERLVNFMDLNPEVGVCGSFIETFGKSNHIWRYEVTDDMIKPCVLYKSLVPHAASIIRSDLLREYKYTFDYPYIEDRALWLYLFSRTKFSNLPEVLYKYRILSHNVTQRNLPTRTERALKFYRKVFDDFEIKYKEENLILFLGLKKELYHSKLKLKALKQFHEEILTWNKEKYIFDNESLESHLKDLWNKVSGPASKGGLLNYINYLMISKSLKIKFKDVKNLIR